MYDSVRNAIFKDIMNLIKLPTTKLICIAVIIGIPGFLIINEISGRTLLKGIQCTWFNPQGISGAYCANSIPDAGTPKDAEKFKTIARSKA
ncbi:MAG: hypothetical protein HC785_00240 [Calothrix sp. CSU_2_0]|nr:hypothetical protein [Calothrix sp. CSU_2_0]